MSEGTTYERISVRPVTPVIGAEIEGVHLDEPLDEVTVQEIQDALTAHQVIFFRDQDISWSTTRPSEGGSESWSRIPTTPGSRDIPRS